MTDTDRNPRCVLIALEGIDRSGKSTQAVMLAAWARHMGYKTQLLKFPAYSTSTGRRITKLLESEGADPKEIHTLMAENRREALPSLLRAMADSGVLVVDRYTDSNIAYGVANGLDRGWLASLDHTMPRPDAVILLDMGVDESFRRRPGGDIFESDRTFMARVADAYRKEARSGGWYVVECSDIRGTHAAVRRCAAMAIGRARGSAARGPRLPDGGSASAGR